MRRPSPTTLRLGCATLAAVGTGILPGPSLFNVQATGTSRPPPRQRDSQHQRNKRAPPRPSAPALTASLGAGAAAAEAALGIDGTARSLQVSDGKSANDGGAPAKLRAVLLENYDRNAYPWQAAWEDDDAANRPRTGLPVEVGINFHRVFAVDIKSATTDLIVWFRQSWTDPRLKWDPADYGNLTTAWFWIGDGMGAGETSEIWTPDLELWNMAEGLQDSLTDAYASVTSDGVVFWSRPGHLRPACKFDGLDGFPFDTLGCTMEFGSWVHSGLYVRPVKMDEGFSIGGSDTAGQTFAEYTIPSDDPDAVEAWEHVYPPYPVAPEEDWPVLMYHVKFARSWQPYTRGYLTTQVILNFAGFAAFWLPVPCGERMGLSITALLAAVASELVVSANLPNAAEMTWFQAFSLFSLAFAALALFESVAVLYLFYYTGNDLVPRWWRWIENRPVVKRAGKMMRKRGAEKNKGVKAKKSDGNGFVDTQPTVASKESGSDPLELDVTERAGNLGVRGVANESPKVKFEEEVAQESSRSSEDNLVLQEGVTFEARTDPIEIRSALKSRPSLFGESLDPYISDSTASLMNHARDADDFRDVGEAERNLRWKRVSHAIDEVCRVVVPTAYLIILAYMLVRADNS